MASSPAPAQAAAQAATAAPAIATSVPASKQPGDQTAVAYYTAAAAASGACDTCATMIDLLSFMDTLVQPQLPPPPRRTPDVPLQTPWESGLSQRTAAAHRMEDDQFYETHEGA